MWIGILIGVLVGGGIAVAVTIIGLRCRISKQIRSAYENNLTQWEKDRLDALKASLADYEQTEIEKARSKAAEEYERLRASYNDYRAVVESESGKVADLNRQKNELAQSIENYKAAVGKLFREEYNDRAHLCDLEVEAYRLECEGKRELMKDAMAADELNWQNAHLELEDLVNHCQALARHYNEMVNGTDTAVRCKLNSDQIDELMELWRAVKGLRVVNPAPLYKAIFEMYLRGPIKDMLNDVEAKGGIYCITDCVSGLAYVGKTTNFKDRWLTHLKRGGYYEEGTAAGSTLYAAMKEHGVWNFKFEVLEEVEDTGKLGEKEKLWIEELDTVKNGLNMKAGG